MLDYKIKTYLDKLKKSGLSDKSIETYDMLLGYFARWYDEYGLLTDNLVLVEKDVEKFIEWLKKRDLSVSTIKMVLNRTKEFIEFSGGKWLVDKRIYRERNKVESAKPFSEIELKTISEHLKANNKIYYYLCLTLYGFGVRISEATNLLPEDIIEKENQIFVRVKSDIAKFQKSREAPLILKGTYRDDFIDFIVKRKNPKLKDKTLFTYYNDIQKRVVSIDKNNVKVYFHNLSKELGIHITAHRFRDTYISYMVAKGIKPLSVAKWVGHEDISTTLKYYAKLTSKDELEELNKL